MHSTASACVTFEMRTRQEIERCHEIMVCRLPDGRLTFSNPDCGSAHEERGCEKTTGGFGGSDELCVGFGRGLVVVVDDELAGNLPIRELRLSAAWSI